MSSITDALMGDNTWEIELRRDTPEDVLRRIDLRDHAFSQLIVTRNRHRTHTLSDATIRGLAIYSGIYLDQSGDRYTLEGEGLEHLLGGDDGGVSYAGADASSTGKDVEAQLEDLVIDGGFNRGNGITEGTFPSNATTFTVKLEGGQTPRQNLDTICSMAPGGPYEWRINPDGTLDVDTPANLFNTGQVILSQGGGHDPGTPRSVRADIALDGYDVRAYATNVQVDWNDGTNNGAASNTPPAGWVGLAGDPIIRRAHLDSRPKGRIRGKETWIKIAAWLANSQTRANNMATREANDRASYRTTVTIEIDEHDAWEYLAPGDTIYLYDPPLGLVDNTATPVQHRGRLVFPVTARVDQLTSPVRRGMGVYLRIYNGASFELVDLSDWVEYAEGGTKIECGRRQRFHKRNARARRGGYTWPRGRRWPRGVGPRVAPIG